MTNFSLNLTTSNTKDTKCEVAYPLGASEFTFNCVCLTLSGLVGGLGSSVLNLMHSSGLQLPLYSPMGGGGFFYDY